MNTQTKLDIATQMIIATQETINAFDLLKSEKISYKEFMFEYVKAHMNIPTFRLAGMVEWLEGMSGSVNNQGSNGLEYNLLCIDNIYQGVGCEDDTDDEDMIYYFIQNGMNKITRN